MRKIIFLCCSMMAVVLANAQSPFISVNPSSLSGELFTGQSTVLTVSVSNSGTAPLNCLATVEPLSSTGMVNNALQFDGSNDYCVIYNDPPLQLSEDLTIEAWVNFQPGGTGQPALISKGRPQPHYEVFFDTTLASRKIGLILDPVGTILSQTTLVADTWYHVAFTYDGSMMRIYINGELDASQTGSGDLNSTNYGLYFGKRDNTTNHKYKGILDDVRIWHVARSQDEIRHTMNHEFFTADTNMSGYWNFNEISGTKAYDLTPHSNNANLVSGVARVPSNARIINWLDANPVSFSIPPGPAFDLSVSLNSNGMDGGTYAGQINLKSNDLVNPQVLIPVQLDVIPVPNMICTVTQLNFGEIFVNMQKSMDLLLSNDGNDTLRIFSMTCQNSEFQVEPATLKIAPDCTSEVEVTYSPLSPGVDVADLVILSNDPDMPVVTVQLMATALAPPVISVSPAYFDINLYSGRVLDQFFTISNSGGSDLDFNLVNNAISFDGSVDYIQVDNSQLYNLSAMTLELWVSMSGFYDDRGIITLGDSDSERFTLWMDNGLLKYQHNWEQGNDQTITLPYPQEYSWHHLAIAYQASTIKYYLDGDLVKTSAIEAPVNFEDGYALYFGNEIGGVENLFYGMMDEVRIWNYACTQAEIRGNMWSGLTGNEPGLVGYWRFEEMDGDIAIDMTANENDGILFGNIDRTEWPMTPSWLQQEPVYASCQPGEGIDISLLIDACNMCGGEHLFDIMVSSNDPENHLLQVPVTLQITDAPCIFATKDTLDFGTLYAGFDIGDTLTLDVINRGSLDLIITGLTATSGAFTASPGFAGIDPGESETFEVYFNPSSVGTYLATLVFSSNDPLDEEYSIVLKGKYLVPPDISVTPLLLEAELNSGKQSHTSFTVHNTGGSDLEFNISPGINNALEMDGADDYIWWSNFSPVNNVPLSQFTFECWVYFDDNSYYTLPIFNASVCYGNYSMNIILTGDHRVHFSLYDDNWTYHEVYSSAIEGSQWTHLACTYDGTKQKIFLNGDEDVYTTWAGTFTLTGYGILGRQSSWYYYYFDGSIDEVRLWQDARTTAEINGAMYRELSGMEEGLIGYWNFNEIQGNLAIDQTPNQNNGVLYGGPVLSEYTPPACSWILCDPISGVCPIGSTVHVDVTFDASFLMGGLYETEIMLFSNDPDDPMIGIDVSLEVTDAPSIKVLEEALDFGEVFIGYPKILELEVVNNGSQDLLITGITAVPYVFTASPPYVSIDPGESEMISVQFSPISVMHYSGTLTLLNNDPLQEQFVIQLDGNGLIAPEIGVSTTSLDVSLEPGEIEERSISILNSGGSELHYSILPDENQGLAFNGEDNYMEVPYFNPLQNSSINEFTFESWIYLNGFDSEEQYIFSAVGVYSYYPMVISTTSDHRIRFFIYDNSWNYREVYSSPLQPGTWYHLACVYDGSAQRIFINGEEEAVYNWYGQFTITSGLVLGRYFTESFGYLDGILDETRIWQISRSADQINQDIYRELPAGVEGLVAYWTYDNIDGATVVDQSGFYNDGFLSGTTLAPGFKSPLHEWLVVMPASGNCPPSGNINTIVTFDAAGMALGDYYRTLKISSNDPDLPLIAVPVHMHVGYGVGMDEEVDGESMSVVVYPNPFNGSTRIKYFLAEEGQVKLVIYDQLGRQVGILCDEQQSAGEHEVTWKAERLSAGVYFFKLAVGGQQSAVDGKLILLR